MNAIPSRMLRSRGVSIVTAIFLLVVLSAIGVAIVGLSATQQRGAVLDLLGARAYEAARAGVEVGLFQLTRNGSCANADFVPPGSLSAFTVTVRCQQSTTPVSDGQVLTQTRITATACNLPTAGGQCPGVVGRDYVQRVVQVTF